LAGFTGRATDPDRFANFPIKDFINNSPRDWDRLLLGDAMAWQARLRTGLAALKKQRRMAHRGHPVAVEKWPAQNRVSGKCVTPFKS
jgi:hypothetical protein